MSERAQHCWICRERYTTGFNVGLLVSSKGGGKRQQKYSTIACICEKCAKSPGGAHRRHPLWMALRDGIRQAVAHIETSREVLTN